MGAGLFGADRLFDIVDLEEVKTDKDRSGAGCFAVCTAVCAGVFLFGSKVV